MAKSNFFSQPVGFVRRNLNKGRRTFTPADDNPRRKFINEDDVVDIPLLNNDGEPSNVDDPTNEDIKYDSHHRPSSPYMPAGDSFRGIGVIIVILYHMGYQRYKNAWFCISLFFSLSGFIMTKSTVESFERHGYVDVYKFWARRISRLFPVLFLTVIVIMLSQELPFRVNDGVTFQREKMDLFYATIFVTNYNLAYNHLDDYFDDFATPSVTRHLWTLSIEEQYYIIWPLVLLLLTTVVISMSKKEYELGSTVNRFAISGTSRRCIGAILILDVVVMALSYVSSMAVVHNHGTTAAYYSTTCRMGDIAAGGFAYSSVRLIPSVARRWYRDPSLPPMTLKLRILLELMVGALLLSLIVIPMIQTPEDIMLLLYFKWWRLLVSLIIYGVVASTIQLAEPLPSWAIVSKILSFKPLVLVGVFSYGVYIFHWPLLVYFGDPTGTEKRKVEMGLVQPSDGILGYDGQNAFLFVVSMVMGYFSFMYFEKPLLQLSKVTMPRKTIFTGFMSMGFTLITIWFITKDLPPMETFENDYAAFGGSVDSRFTPILTASRKDHVQRLLFSDVLDYQTRTITAHIKSYDEIIESYRINEFQSSDTFVIAVCKDLAQRSPCDDPDIWRDETYWIWLDSPDLCKQKKDDKRSQLIVQERCEDIISISELTVDEVVIFDRAAYSMVLGINDALPGILNQQSVSRMKKKYRVAIGGDETLSTQSNTGEKWDSIRMLMLGESVGIRLAMFWKDYMEMDMPLLNIPDNTFPTISEIENLAEGGRPAISYFACLSTHPKYQYDICHRFENDKPSIILDSFESIRPNVLIIHDSHWSSKEGEFGKSWGKHNSQLALNTGFERTMAFNIMLNSALESDIEQIFFITKSPKMRTPKAGYVKEMKNFMEMVDTIACSGGDPSSMRVTAIDWSRLICPDIMEAKYCKQEVHGFDRILNDGIHPFGDSGLWLTRETLALVIAEIAKYNLPDKFGSYSSWDEGIENPISKQLMKLAPSDGKPLLKDVVSSYYVCPYKDLEALEVKFNQTSFRNYKDYQDSVHFEDYKKHSDNTDSNAVSFFDAPNSNEYLNWYSDAQEIAGRYDHRHFIRGPDPSRPGIGAVIDWTVDGTHLHLAVAAPATGWLGFGISDAGGGVMGVDMVIFESGNPGSLRDTYTTDEGKPQTDDCANWELVSAEIKSGYIFFETVRLLDTKDAQDRKITNDSNLLTPPHRVVVAWGNSETVDSIKVNNGRGSIRFFQEETLEPFNSVMEREAEGSFTVQAVNYQVPNIETNYFHTCVTTDDLIARGVPNSDKKKMVIGFEPYIQSSNTQYVHHFLLFGFTSDACGSKAYEPGELIYFWALGYQALALPDFLGLPFNGRDELNSFRIQIHYHNPLKQSDIIDSSGVRLYWTSKMRREEMGLFQVGDPQVRKESTKLGKGLSRHDFKCPSSCSENFVGKPVTVIKEVHHMHQTGKQTILDHFRNGKKLRSGKVEYFDFYYNGFPEVIQEPFTIEPGDTFTMSCFFEDDKGANTIFGLGSKDEMCLGYYIYYPRVKKENWMCGYDNRDYHCSAGYKRELLPDEKALGRGFPFGDEGRECTAVS